MMFLSQEETMEEEHEGGKTNPSEQNSLWNENQGRTEKILGETKVDAGEERVTHK